MSTNKQLGPGGQGPGPANFTLGAQYQKQNLQKSVRAVRRENVSTKSAQKRHDGSDGVQIGGRVHCGGERPGIWGALLPSPTSHHLPIQLSGPLCSARLCTTSHEQSSSVLSPPSLLCVGSCKVCRCRAEELPLSRAETNLPPPPALKTVQSRAGWHNLWGYR